MDLLILSCLLALTAVAMLLERMGLPVTLNLDFKGDIKRESRWFAQYGQAACTIVVAALIWRLDVPRRPDGHRPLCVFLLAVFGTSLVSTILKRLLGRVRPGRQLAGQFLGLSLQHANSRESFPSSHSAAAVAMSVILAHLYPPAAPVFWTLAILCALLRYLMDAHWPSDVLAGVALGYAAATLTWNLGI
jgi:membrane-associated phospholipid phosphatase